MSEKFTVKNEDGTEEEKEFFSAEEIDTKVNETKEEWETKVKELEENSDPNWKEARATMKTQAERIKTFEESGKTINDAGEVVDSAPKALTPEESEIKMREITRTEQVNLRKEEHLNQYDEETRKVVEHNFNKLTAGEEVNMNNMQTFIDQAELLAIPGKGNPVRKAMVSTSGVAADGVKENFAETDGGKALAESMGLKFINKKE